MWYAKLHICPVLNSYSTNDVVLFIIRTTSFIERNNWGYKMKSKNYPTVGTVPTPNIKIEEIRKIDTSSA
jgi:hypothetical protein